MLSLMHQYGLFLPQEIGLSCLHPAFSRPVAGRWKVHTTVKCPDRDPGTQWILKLFKQGVCVQCLSLHSEDGPIISRHPTFMVSILDRELLRKVCGCPGAPRRPGQRQEDDDCIPSASLFARRARQVTPRSATGCSQSDVPMFKSALGRGIGPRFKQVCRSPKQ